jgi:hypothetical protein
METTSKEIGYSIKRLDKNRLKDLAVLYTAVYNCRASKNYFLKKYDTSYTGVENVGYIAYDQGKKPVAFYGVIPCFIQYENQIILAAQSADTMTHPSHRCKGLFKKLATITFDLCRMSGIAFIFGFPNQNSYHGLLSLGWEKMETMERFVIPVNSFSLESLLYKRKWTRWLYKYYAAKVLKKYFYSLEGLPNSIADDKWGRVYRDEKYLYYKTYTSSEVIKIGESKIWIKFQNGLVIGDAEMVYNDKEFDKVMNEIKKIAKRLGISQICFQASPGTCLYNLFARKYNSFLSFPILFLDLSSDLPLSKIKFTFADMDIF